MVDQTSRLNLFQRYASRYWKLALGVFIFGALLYTPMIYIWFMDGISAVHLPPRDCDRLILDEVYCQKFYADDGHIRYSISSSEYPNCCVVNRKNLSYSLGSYRVLTCDRNNNSPIICEEPERADGTDFDHLIQGRGLLVDTSWPEHKSFVVWKDDDGEWTNRHSEWVEIYNQGELNE